MILCGGVSCYQFKRYRDKKALEFQKLNIETIGDLLNRFPRMDSYLDYSKVKRIGELTTDNEKQLFTGEVFRVADKYSGRGKRYTVITVQDDGSYADIFCLQRSGIRPVNTNQVCV